MVEVDAHTSQLHEAQASTNGLRPRHSTRIRESARGQQFDRIIPGNPALGKVGDAIGPAEKLYEPELARANIAATIEAPDGTTKNDWADNHKQYSVLEQHCLVWDRDGDGYIWPIDTYRGFHELGYHFIISVSAIFIIHFGFAWFTMGWPDPLFRLKLRRMHKAKHGSDTGAYSREGYFVPARFEAIFSKYDRGNKGGLTFWEGKLSSILRNRLPFYAGTVSLIL
ncbi:hypothetical protein QFC20_000188 [Naganishia adeliensis]|uniref:Uncharacterized protein n=1 Tax=Naganishia adeliensis TaxID=92952 RepID=A0ACC2X1Z3_9TREE|nr:hypothetical protein QFC20_000188 [Naganishia adeliensis]